MKPKPTHADLAGFRYLALQRLAQAQEEKWFLKTTEVGEVADRS